MKTRLIILACCLLILGGLTAQINNPTGGGTPGGDCSGTIGALVCTKTNGASFATSATTDATNAANISSGVLPVARLNRGSYSSGTQTASIAATTLCSTTNCPAGTYLIGWYEQETGTGCTTVTSGGNTVSVNYIDNQAVSRADIMMNQSGTGSANVTGKMAFTTGGNGHAAGWQIVNTNGSAVAGTDALQILTTVTACATPGTWSGYQVRAYVVPIG